MSKELHLKNFENLDFAKVILTLGVVLSHSMRIYTGTWFNQPPAVEAPGIVLIIDWIHTFLLYAFTLISGYLFYYLRYEKKKYREFVPFLKTKIKRLIVPYIFVAAVWVVPFSIYFFKTAQTELIENYVLGMAPSQLWFLLMLFWVFMIAYILSDFTTRNIPMGVIITGTLFICSLLFGRFIPDFFQIFTAMRFWTYFWLGMLLCKYGTEYLDKIPAWVYLSLDFVLFIIWEWTRGLEQVFFVKLMSMGLSTLLNIIGSIMAVELLTRLADRINYHASAVYEVLNCYSFPVYLFHQQVIYCVLDRFNGAVSPIALVSLNFIAALSVSLLISWLLSKSRPTRFLIGMK